MQAVRAYRVGRLFFRSLSGEDRTIGAQPLERLEIEIGPVGSSSARSERVAQMVIAVGVILAAMVAVTAFQPLAGPLFAGAALVGVFFVMFRRSRQRMGKRLTADSNRIRVEDTTAWRDETRVVLDSDTVEAVEIEGDHNHRSLWAQTNTGERISLLDDLTDEEAEASARKLRDTIPPAPPAVSL